MSDAFGDVSEAADHLRCKIHSQRNIEEKLKQCGIPNREKKQFIHEIFGYQSGVQYNAGIINAGSHEEFDAQLASLESIWNMRELPHTLVVNHNAFTNGL